MKRVKNAKLVMIPTMIPNDFVFPPFTDADKIIGSKGQMQGARIVTNPEINAKTNKITICVLTNTYIIGVLYFKNHISFPYLLVHL